MAQIILDMGSGNTCRNDEKIVKKMLDELKKVDTGNHGHEIIIKFQLFQKAGLNIPLEHGVFGYAYMYAKELGYKTTASIFDKKNLNFLLDWYEVPFVKIANNRELDWLIGEIPRKVPVYVSYGNKEDWIDRELSPNVYMLCVSNYPATIDDYREKFGDYFLNLSSQREFLIRPEDWGISDHTIGLELFKKYKPTIWEKHYKLHDSTGLDSGDFAITPEELGEILK